MEVGQKLELRITAAEVEIFSKALKEEKFQEMLNNYFQDISNPENVKTYEEEMTLLEQKRGNSIEFVHPIPFRVLETSADGQQRCFINICACDKVGKPESKTVQTEGRSGQQWSLPHLLQPGRPDCEGKGNIFTIYDVCFHPETLHLADKSKKFMDMVMGVAIQGIQNAFEVKLDKDNLREIDIKYKGVPQLCVIRKPIPGFETKEPPEERDPSPWRSPLPENSIDVPSKLPQKQPQEPKEPISPDYTVKYCYVVNLEDFRVSRDSTRSSRPTEIVITIDLPLLMVANDTVLEVQERRLLLESKNPSYRLDLLLSYPVDENKGKAKFNKQKRQLRVTLPVQPAPNAPQLPVGPPSPTSDSQNENQTQVEEPEEGRRHIEERADKEGERSQRGNDKDAALGKHQKKRGGQKQKEEGKKVHDPKKNKMPQCEVKNKALQLKYEEKLHDVPEEKKENRNNTKEDKCHRWTKHACGTLFQTPEVLSDTKKQHDKENTTCAVESDVQEAEETKNAQGSVEESRKVTQATTVVKVSVPGENLKGTPTEKMEDADDLPDEQTFQKSEETNGPPPGTLREIDAAGNEPIADQHKPAGFVFQNKLMYELD